jgi:hypothetical protein
MLIWKRGKLFLREYEALSNALCAWRQLLNLRYALTTDDYIKAMIRHDEILCA